MKLYHGTVYDITEYERHYISILLWNRKGY